MYRPVCFLALLVAVAAPPAAAQLQPHQATWLLRLGVGADAPPIGTAQQDLRQDCAGWRIERRIATEFMLPPLLRLALASRLEGEEQRRSFRYTTVQRQNGEEARRRGRVERQDGEMRAESAAPGGPPRQQVLPPPTLMPVAALAHLVERLQVDTGSFPAVAFDPEVTADAMTVEVETLARGALRPRRPFDPRIDVAAERSWPVRLTFGRARRDERPLFTVDALVFGNGVVDRLTVDTGLVTVTADLQALELRPRPDCPGYPSGRP